MLPEYTYAYGIEANDNEQEEGPVVIIDGDSNSTTPVIINTVQETTIEHFRSRKLIYFMQETPDGEPYEHRRDADQNHPWSFKLVPKKVRHVNFQEHDYPEHLDSNDPSEIVAFMDLHAFYPYKEIQWNSRMESQEKTYSGVTEQTSYTYNDRYYPIVTETISSKGDTLTVNNTYAFDTTVSSEAQYTAMVTNNQISTPVLNQTSQNGQILAMQKVNFSQVIDGYKIQSIETAKTDDLNDLEERVVYESYDGHGNISQVRKTDGQPIAYLWGYNRQYPVAKVENATINDVLTSGVGDIQDLDGSALRVALDAIRQNLPNALVTTYTYKPLVGVTSVTDPRGYTIFYEYDAQNRLQYVKDQDGKVYSKNEYHYSTSN